MKIIKKRKKASEQRSAYNNLTTSDGKIIVILAHYNEKCKRFDKTTIMKL